MNSTERLASFVAGLRYSDLPSDVARRTKIIFIDSLASAFAGWSADEASLVGAVAESTVGGGDSTVIGGQGLSAGGAVLVNGYLITAATVCDVHLATVCHTTPQVVPPALAVAESRGSAGSELLASVAAGLEVTTRVGLAVNYEAFRSRGWHTPGVVGPLGGAAAASRILELEPRQVIMAFGIALSQSAGTWAQFGTPTIKFQQSRGALSALLSANLAAEGLGATKDALEAVDGGLFSTYSDGGSPEMVTSGLGESWRLEEISLRPWPVAAYLQSLVTALTSSAGGRLPTAEAIARVVVTLPSVAHDLHAAVGWDTRFRSRLSARYVTSVVIHDGDAWLEQFSSERVRDPTVTGFARERVEIRQDARMPETSARVEITGRDGSLLTLTADHPKGHPADPFTLDDAILKFKKATRERLHRGPADAAASMLADLEDAPDLRALTRLLRRGAAPSAG